MGGSGKAPEREGCGATAAQALMPPLRINMPDGLYQAWARPSGICAGFVIEGGKLVACAPILRRRILEWVRYAPPVVVRVSGPDGLMDPAHR